jgi:hypothetical protein
LYRLRVLYLVPQPQRVERLEGSFRLARDVRIVGASAHAARELLALELASCGLCPEHVSAKDGNAAVALRVDAAIGRPEGYRLDVRPEGIAITGHDDAGLFYGVCTLVQLIRVHTRTDGGVEIPSLSIEDWPDFAARGVMLDISRDKVPKLATLFDLVDLLASLKVNQLQLYMEHTFAYRAHETVWANASPLTASEISELDAYCRDRFVELVPNQNSFGHMHRWLKHPAYRHLAECPDGFKHPWNASGEPYGLCPIEPRSLAFLAELYDELLPCFSSRQLNVGLDETIDLGHGRSRDACAAKGTERVYLEFLHAIHRLVSQHGRTMQFWGDIILHAPDLVAELPRDAIALEWGYEADHPFAEHGRIFASSGLRFYVCPGTSSWNSIAGRTHNAIGNLAGAAVAGRSTGAIGYLDTDWGDNGHLQPLPVAYLGYLAGAEFGWNATSAERPGDLDVAALLDRHVFFDRAHVMGQVVRDLGDAYRLTGVEPHNVSPLFGLLVWDDYGLAEHASKMTPERLRDTLASIEKAGGRLSEADLDRSDAQLVVSEMKWVADMLAVACRLGIERLSAGGGPVEAIAPSARTALADALRPLLAQHRDLWLARNRPGGLCDSLARPMRKLLRLAGKVGP